MHTFQPATAAAPTLPRPLALVCLAAESDSPWAARAFDELVPPDTLAEARAHRDELTRLLRREREAGADFLLALADFDRRLGWKQLGHASLFAFLTRELGLSNGAAYVRSSAARLLPRFPAVEAALRDGRLCLSAVGELARVLTTDNELDVLPRYFGCSAREAREVTAALVPRTDPPRREVVTVVPAPRREPPLMTLALEAPEPASAVSAPAAGAPTLAEAPQLRAHEVGRTHPARAQSAEVEPLTADLRRLHLTVSKGFMDKVTAARTGLSHASPNATTEQVLEAALDLLLERQARSKALVKRPRRSADATPTPIPTPIPISTPTPTPTSTRRAHIPAHIEREVRLRDGGRCQFPLDAGGTCGSTWRVELDHVLPVTLGGDSTAANLRCLCRQHNEIAAERVLGRGQAAARRR